MLQHLGSAICALFFFSFFAQAENKPEPLAIGEKIPDIQAITYAGEEVVLAEEAKSGLTLIFFFPKAFTPGCTTQACDLRDHQEEWIRKGVKIFGVSSDKLETQFKFHEKYKLPYPLLADPEKKVIKAFKVPTLLGMASRQTFLFKDGILIWHDSKAKPSTQSEDLSNFLEKIETQAL